MAAAPDVADIERCIDGEVSVVEDILGCHVDYPEVQKRGHRLLGRLAELRATCREMPPVEVAKRLWKIECDGYRLYHWCERQSAAALRQLARQDCELRPYALRAARRADRRALVGERRLRRELRLTEAWRRLRPARARGDHGRPRHRPRRTRGPPADGEECDPGDPDHVDGRRRGRAP